MRFKRLRVKDMGVFAGDHEWRFDDASRLTAVVGPNGSGKTTMLSLLLGAIYRTCPTRGTLASLARSRDSLVELDVDLGDRAYMFRQAVDAISSKGESLIADDSGEPIVQSVKVTDGDSWTSSHFPAMELVLSSTFSAQGSRGFVAASTGERKHLLLELLAVDHLEGMASEARKRAAADQARVGALEARIADEQARAAGLDQLENDRAAATGEAEHAAQVLEQTRAELREAQAALARHEAALETYRLALSSGRRLEEQVLAALDKARKAETLVKNNRELLADSEQIRAAVARVEQIRQQRTEAFEREATARNASASTWQIVHADEQQMATALAATAAAKSRAEKARERLVDIERVRAAADSLDDLRAAVTTREIDLAGFAASLDELRGRRLQGAEGRIEDLRAGLTEIHDSEDETASALRTLAGSVLEHDDDSVHEAESLPGLLRDADGAHRAAQDALAVALRRLTDAQALAARLPDVEAAAGDLDAAEREQREHSEAATRWRDEARAHTDAAEAHRLAATRAAKHAETLAVDNETAALAAKAEHLAGAEERLRDREQQATEAWREHARLTAEFDATPPPAAPAQPPSPDRLERLEKAAETEHQAAVRRGAELEARIQVARDAATRTEELQTELGAVSAELSDWTRLGSDLGRKGLQAALIDAALGEITETSNWLLHESFGPRWTVRLDTQRLNSTGKKQLEGLDIVVLDTENGREAPIETYSGGEQTILSESISLALSALACRRAGIEHPTLVRDESGAALDPDKAEAYVAMLRRASSMIGASGVLLVSHSPQVIELCDERIELGGSDA
jgi:DNA repair exonuclease SbcCD ATPase subunit